MSRTTLWRSGSRRSSLFKSLGGLLLLWLTWTIHVFHLGVYPRLTEEKIQEGLRVADSEPEAARWLDRKDVGLNHLVVRGTPLQRGIQEGRLTKNLISLQEKELFGQLQEIFPSAVLREVLMLGVMRWFWGIDRYFEPWMTDEMYGISMSGTHELDGLADSFTRQVAYHGLHEVGQLMVDQGGEGMGCTVAALPYRESWILGRNFDFEASRIFDTEKVVKWVFPDRGQAFVSVIWAGMVGAVTGVNASGLYLSLNAAGSTDFSRYGTPSTLVLLKALQFADSAEKAIEIIGSSKMFITDIFVLLDGRSGALYRIEKSPKRTEVLRLDRAAIVTNHLIAPAWKEDAVNLYRKNELTSSLRSQRGEELLKKFEGTPAGNSQEAIEQVLSILRDKGVEQGKGLELGNRRAIDPLIATHSVIYDPLDGKLFVSQGPGVSGAFLGYDLRRSFAEGKPVAVERLPGDPLVSAEKFARIRASAKKVSQAEADLRHGRCDLAAALMTEAAGLYTQASSYYAALGDLAHCEGKTESALLAWRKALELTPAYAGDVRALEKRLKGAVKEN